MRYRKPVTVLAAAAVAAALAPLAAAHAAASLAVTVTQTVTSAAGGVADYTVTFQAPTSITSTDGPITTTFPDGLHPGFRQAAITDATTGTPVGFCSPNATSPSIDCYLTASSGVPAGHIIEEDFNGSVNPLTPSDHNPVTVNAAGMSGTAADFNITAANTVSGVTATPSNLQPDAAGVTYTIAFTTSATGGLSYQAGSSVTVNFPAGTSIAGGTADSLWYDTTTGRPAGLCQFASTSGNPVAFCATSSIYPYPVAPGDSISIPVNAVTNPPAGAYHVTVETSSDAAGPAQSANYTIGGSLAAPDITELQPPAGPLAGTTVIIQGRNLAGATEVTVAGQAVPFTQNPSGSGLAVTVPPDRATPSGPDSVTVQVFNQSGPGTPGTFEYLPPPTVTSVTPPEGPETGGNIVTVAGANLLYVTGVRFASHAAAVATPGQGAEISVVAPAGTGATSITVTTDGGTVTVPDAYRYLTARPKLTVTATPSPSLYGQPVTVTASITPFSVPAAVTFRFDYTDKPVTVQVAPDGTASTVAFNAPAGTRTVTASIPDAGLSATARFSIGKAATALRAEAAVAALSPLQVAAFDLTATLTTGATGTPLAGQRIVFAADGRTICSAVTDVSGTASCPAGLSALNVVAYGGYIAYFAGNSNYRPSRASAPVLGV